MKRDVSTWMFQRHLRHKMVGTTHHLTPSWVVGFLLKHSYFTISQDFVGFFFFVVVVVFLGPHPKHMEVPRLGVKSELQVQAYTATTVIQDLRRIRGLYQSSKQCQILNSLGKTRYGTSKHMDIRRICHHWAMMGTPNYYCFLYGISPLSLLSSCG